MRPRFKFLVALAIILAVATNSPAQWPMASPASAETTAPVQASPVMVASVEAPSDYQLWGEAEYLLWWMKPVCQKRPLLYSGSDADPVPGAAGQPGTRTILGQSKYEMPGASGLRGTAGICLTDCPSIGWEASGFWLHDVSNTQAFTSQNGGPHSFVPFTDQNNVTQALPFSVPGEVDGSITATGSSQLWGAEMNVVGSFLEDVGPCTKRASLLCGFRYINLRDEIQIVQKQTSIADPTIFAVGAANYTTHNRFLGPQVGARFEAQWGRWDVEATGKFAPGEVLLQSDIAGDPLVAGTQVILGSVPGPLLAFPSNVGRKETWALAFAQELTLRLRCRITDNASFSLGYNLLYLNRIACPGDQMPVIVNVTQLPELGPLAGRPEPKPLLLHTDYFAQGLSAGLELRY